MRKLFVWCLLGVMTLFGHEEGYHFGVFPHMPLEKLHKVYSVVVNDLESELNVSMDLMSRPYYAQYKQELLKGVYDIAFIQPLDYVDAHESQGYIPIARRAKDLSAIMVVLKDSLYENIDDVKNKVIASAPSEAAVTQMMLHSLSKKGYKVLDEFTISYSKNHFSCLQKVRQHKASACITAQRALEYFKKETKSDDFNIIYTTETIPHALFVVHPRVPEKTRVKIQDRILHWKDDKKGRELLQTGNLLNFRATDDKEYDRVREFLRAIDE